MGPLSKSMLSCRYVVSAATVPVPSSNGQRPTSSWNVVTPLHGVTAKLVPDGNARLKLALCHEWDVGINGQRHRGGGGEEKGLTG